ncbi:MAG: ABC transporter substrate-binding protein [Pseudomonadota bacterium]
MSNEIRERYLYHLMQAAHARRIDRRRFLQIASAAGVSLAAASSLYSKAAKAAPSRGGHFRIGSDDGNTTDQLDPATTVSAYMIHMNHGIRSYLTEITQDNVVGPDIAKSWESTPDASVWTLKLHKGVEFHNGKTFTAVDARDSLNHHRGEDSKSAAKALLAGVEDITAEDDHTLIVRLKAGSADFPYVLTDYHLVMMPSDGEGNVDANSGIGTGGYMIDRHEPGVRSSFKRHPNYFKDGRAWFDSVEIIAIPDANARGTAITTGELDTIIAVDKKTAHLMSRDPNIEVLNIPSGSHFTLPMFMDVAPFDNNDVRLALKYAFDRQALLDTILRGYGTIGNDTPIGPTLPYWADIEQRQYDPDKAKFHLKKSGHDSIKVTLSTSEVPYAGATDTAILYKEKAAAVGIDIDVVREPNDGYWSNVWNAKPFCVASWGARPTPDVMFTLAYAAEAAWNDTHFQHERFNKLLLQGRAELDDGKRAEIYREMQVIMRDEGGVIVPIFQNFVYAHRSNVKHGDKVAGNWALDGHRAMERWWFA